MVKIRALYSYPVKSLRGVPVETLTLEAAGPRWDREWMLVDAGTGVFVTQRQLPGLQLLTPALNSDYLSIRANGAPELAVPLSAGNSPRRKVDVWGDAVDAVDEGEDAAAWFRERTGRDLRLVRMGAARRVTGGPGRERSVRFVDSAPLLVVSVESLADLSARAGVALEPERFRPNFLVEGAAAYAEDGWNGLRINDIYLKAHGPCVRCGITTIDPVTIAKGPEPLRTLATYRRGPKGVQFGHYFLGAEGEVRVGMELKPD